MGTRRIPILSPKRVKGLLLEDDTVVDVHAVILGYGSVDESGRVLVTLMMSVLDVSKLWEQSNEQQF